MRNANRLKMDAELRELSGLINSIESITPDRSVLEVAELFLSRVYSDVMSLPVIENGQLIGVISRHSFLDMYLKELYLKQCVQTLHSKRSIRHYINTTPLRIEFDEPFLATALMVAENLARTPALDFVVTRNDRYLGTVTVKDLLRAMEAKIGANADAINGVYLRIKSLQLMQSEQMKPMGQMVAGVANEINAPLGYMQNNVAMGQALFMQVGQMIEGYESLFDSLLSKHTSSVEISRQMQQLMKMRRDLNAQEVLTEMQDLMTDSLYGIGQISKLVVNLKTFASTDLIAA